MERIPEIYLSQKEKRGDLEVVVVGGDQYMMGANLSCHTHNEQKEKVLWVRVARQKELEKKLTESAWIINLI